LVKENRFYFINQKGVTMIRNKKTLGATIAAAAALTFATAPISTAFAADTAAGQVQCYGVNACKGQSECKTAANSCKGQNNCKGSGTMMMTADDCTAKGGTTDAPKTDATAPAPAAN
jgi:hypothetical protein